jgi:hypothetical protein
MKHVPEFNITKCLSSACSRFRQGCRRRGARNHFLSNEIREKIHDLQEMRREKKGVSQRDLPFETPVVPRPMSYVKSFWYFSAWVWSTFWRLRSVEVTPSTAFEYNHIDCYIFLRRLCFLFIEINQWLHMLPAFN